MPSHPSNLQPSIQPESVKGIIKDDSVDAPHVVNSCPGFPREDLLVGPTEKCGRTGATLEPAALYFQNRARLVLRGVCVSGAYLATITAHDSA